MLRTKKSHHSHGSIRSFLSIVISIGLISASLFLWLNRQYVVDWIAYNEFTPSSEVAEISSRTALTDEGKFYFYASKPMVASAADFNRLCERKEANSAILGCYANNRIYVYDIENAQLDGIKEVTSAHEMLHAVYQRMGDDERAKVDALLEKEYQKIKDDKELSERMAFYAKYEAGERYNELHSIIATEVTSIDSELEAHYAEYFSDRAAVVALHTKYASVFNALKAKSDQLLSQLKTLGPQIEAESLRYNNAVKQLNVDIQSFNTRAKAGNFTSAAAFNSERAALEARATALDTQRTRVNQSLSRYEAIRKQYNDTAASSNDLYKSMDSKLAPSPSV